MFKSIKDYVKPITHTDLYNTNSMEAYSEKVDSESEETELELGEPACKIITIPSILKAEITKFAKDIADDDFKKHLIKKETEKDSDYLPNRYDMHALKYSTNHGLQYSLLQTNPPGRLYMTNTDLYDKLQKFAGFNIDLVTVMDYDLDKHVKHHKTKHYTSIVESAKENGFSEAEIEKGYYEAIHYHNDESRDTMILYIEKDDTIMAEKTCLMLGTPLKEVEFNSHDYWKAGAIHFTNNAEHKIDIFGTGRRLIIVLFGESLYD